jgi:hypothetical protein
MTGSNLYGSKLDQAARSPFESRGQPDRAPKRPEGLPVQKCGGRKRQTKYKDYVSLRSDVQLAIRRAILQYQNNKCALCECSIEAERSVIDHIHLSDSIRGVTCKRCNTIVGKIEGGPSVSTQEAKANNTFKGIESLHNLNDNILKNLDAHRKRVLTFEIKEVSLKIEES